MDNEDKKPEASAESGGRVDSVVMRIDGDHNDDYVIRITKPNGDYIKVMVPKDFKGKDDNPYGLNMVCNGHYM